MAWSIEGTYFENCTCDVACPCTVSSLMLPADRDHCSVVLAFNVEQGDVEGTDVAGVTVAVVANSPQAMMAEGNWKVGLVIDDAASEEQAGAIGKVFSGELGGPMAMLSDLIGEFAGVERAPISYENDGVIHRLRIGDDTDVEIEDLLAPESTEPVRITNVRLPVGDTVTIAKTNRSRVSAFGLDFEGNTGSAAPFAWSG